MRLLQRQQDITMSRLWSKSRQRSAKKQLGTYTFSKSMDIIAQQRKSNLEKLQVSAIVKKAIAEDEGIRERLFEFIQRRYPDVENPFEIFQRHLENITSTDLDGELIADFAGEVVDYLDMGDYQVEENE